MSTNRGMQRSAHRTVVCASGSPRPRAQRSTAPARPPSRSAEILAVVVGVGLASCHFGGAPMPPTTAPVVPAAAPSSVRLADFSERARWSGLTLRVLAQELWSLGGDSGQRDTERTKTVAPGTGAFEFEASGPQRAPDGSPRFFSRAGPTDEALAIVLSRHCALKGNAEYSATSAGHRAVTWRGREMRSGALCELRVLRTPDQKSWRFRIRLQGR